MQIDVPDSPKSLRETLCWAQSLIRENKDNAQELVDADIARLQRLIDECDRHRPLGPDGKHGDMHTATCGCEDQQAGVAFRRRVARLLSGDWSFGHYGQHRGVGSMECPSRLHHHHDEFCSPPTTEELEAAEIDPVQFRLRSGS